MYHRRLPLGRVLFHCVWLFLLWTGACQCASGTVGGNDATTRRNLPDSGTFRTDDAGNIIPQDGSGIPTNPNDQCGDPGQRCCQGGGGSPGSCSTGLTCDEEDICCAEPGGAECQTTGDCCIPFGCQDGRCVASGGSSCDSDSECLDGLACIEGSCQPGRPGEDGGEGSPCTLTEDCNDGLFCGEDATCQPAGEGGDGDTCMETGDCERGLVCLPDEQVCRPAGDGEPGDPCEGVEECQAGLQCEGGQCEPPTGDEGSPCTLTEDCDEGLYCAEDGTCRPAGDGGDGDSCSDTGDCQRGLVCVPEGVCRPSGGRDPGDECESIEDCEAGLQCEGGQCETNSDCGGRREPCCSGGSCTRRGTVCTEGMCQPCGEEGEPCCDGSAPCGTSTRLVCSRGECLQPQGGCGRVGRECCEPDGACVFGAECNDSSGMCEEEGNPDDPDSDCGESGESCCDGDSCSSGQICDPFLTDSCVPLEQVLDVLGNIPCGQEGELCCPPLLTCEGSLRCDFLRCTAEEQCSALSEQCTQTQDCCQRFDTLCKATGTGKRCCRPQNGRCGDSLDCCGAMTCNPETGRCQCVEQGSSCQSAGDCCAIEDAEGKLQPADCIEGTCQMAEGQSCKGRQTMCSGEGSQSSCCSGLRCGERPRAFDSTVCCVPGNGSCREDEDCCGFMRCEPSEQGGNTCQPVEQGGPCTGYDDECRGDLGCVFGQCTSTGGCGTEQANCRDNTECCGNVAACEPLTEGGPSRCCGRSTRKNMGSLCTEDDDCCGDMTCGEEEHCVCRGAGESCVGTVDCCQGFVCNADNECVSTGP